MVSSQFFTYYNIIYTFQVKDFFYFCGLKNYFYDFFIKKCFFLAFFKNKSIKYMLIKYISKFIERKGNIL